MKIKYKWGTIDGKRQRLWTKIGWCKTCGEPFEKINVRRQVYCFLCARNSKRTCNRQYEHYKRLPNRDKDEHADNERKNYNNRPIYKNSDMERTKKISATTNHVVGEPQADWTPEQWEEYSKKIQKMKTATYSDSYYNTYE